MLAKPLEGTDGGASLQRAAAKDRASQLPLGAGAQAELDELDVRMLVADVGVIIGSPTEVESLFISTAVSAAARALDSLPLAVVFQMKNQTYRSDKDVAAEQSIAAGLRLVAVLLSVPEVSRAVSY